MNTCKGCKSHSTPKTANFVENGSSSGNNMQKMPEPKELRYL